LSIDKLVLKLDENGNQPKVGGFILLGFPHSQIHAEKLKEHGINFDKILYCTDLSEEEAGKDVQQRMVKNDFHYDWATESEKAQAILAVAKEFINEEICKEIDCKGTIDNNLIKIRNEIDPFFIRVDNVEDVKTSADLDEEGRRLPKGDFGNYCPVTYVNHGFLIPGSFEAEQEATILGKTFKLAGEKEMEEFKFNPGKYLIGQNG
jgi:adenylate/nucleoside-diphosphate kinase